MAELFHFLNKVVCEFQTSQVIIRAVYSFVFWFENDFHQVQFVIFKPLLSYFFEEAIRFNVKALFTSRPVSPLISWYNNQVI